MERQEKTAPCRCNACVSFPLLHAVRFSMFAQQEYGLDFDDQMYDFLHIADRARVDADHVIVDEETAERAARNAVYRVEKLKRELEALTTIKTATTAAATTTTDMRDSSSTLTSTSTSTTTRARPVAPLVWKELVVGSLLGNGGFSSVREIVAIHVPHSQQSVTESGEPGDDAGDPLLPTSQEFGENKADDGTCSTTDSDLRPYTAFERASREFLSRHAIRDKNSINTFIAGSRLAESKQKKDGPVLKELLPRYAVKHLKVSIAKDTDRYRKAAVDLALEAELLMNLDHPNIIKIRGRSRAGPDGFRTGKATSFFFVMDMLPETLDERIWQWRWSLKKYKSRCNMIWGKQKYAKKIQNLLADRLRVGAGIAAALEHMHSKRIINRDVKASNVGFDIHGQAKMYDLGLSRTLPINGGKDDTYHMSCVGTKNYMAPEIRNKLPYNLSADVHSFGILLWEILALSTPLASFYKPQKGCSLAQAKRHGVYFPVCACWPTAVQNLVLRSTSYEPTRRPCMAQVRTTLGHQLQVLGMEVTLYPLERQSSFEVEVEEMQLEKDFRNSLESLTTQSFDAGDSSHKPEDEIGIVAVNPTSVLSI